MRQILLLLHIKILYYYLYPNTTTTTTTTSYYYYYYSNRIEITSTITSTLLAITPTIITIKSILEQYLYLHSYITYQDPFF